MPETIYSLDFTIEGRIGTDRMNRMNWPMTNFER